VRPFSEEFAGAAGWLSNDAAVRIASIRTLFHGGLMSAMGVQPECPERAFSLNVRNGWKADIRRRRLSGCSSP
jgi:hypothetical protein